METLSSAQLRDVVSSELGLPVPAQLPDRELDGVEKSPEQFAKEYFLYNLLRKVEPFSRKEEVPDSVLRASLAAFADAEHNCRVMNQCGRYFSVVDEELDLLFSEASRLAKVLISRWLSDFWPDWEEARFTGGASRLSSRRFSLPALKLAGFSERGQLSITTPALPYYRYYREGITAVDRGYTIVDDSRFDFVAKTAKAVRFIAMEPELNMLLQKSVGDTIRAALRKAGIDLNTQRLNQDLAYHGSVFRNLGTIDLSSASDTLSIELVRQYLPKRFLRYVLDLRTPYTSVGGKKHRLEKVASMGNGFIFELQSLIYAAFAHAMTLAVGGRECDIAIYGDDIIVSGCVVEPLMQFLEWHGFCPNLEKSYWGQDPFRESCGKHYFAGRDVTPVYVKGSLDNLPALFRLFNSLKRWEEQTGIRIPDTLALVLSYIPKRDRVLVPKTYSITAGLHFPVKGCVFPRTVYVRRYQRLIRRGRYMTEKQVDISKRLDDEVRYVDWLRNPPEALLPLEVWRKFSHRSHHHGLPRERKSYRNVSPFEAGSVWSSYEDWGEMA